MVWGDARGSREQEGPLSQARGRGIIGLRVRPSMCNLPNAPSTSSTAASSGLLFSSLLLPSLLFSITQPSLLYYSTTQL